jgi:hypothetical protein
MTGTDAKGADLSGVIRLTWVTDRLAHVLQHSQSGEPSGTWTGLACPDYGLEIGTDVSHPMLERLVQGELADFVWEAPADFTNEHGQLTLAAIRTHQDGKPEGGEQLWHQVQTLWSRARSANQQALGLLQTAGLTRFSPAKPQRWVVASFEHHCSPHGLPHPHIHNIVIPALTAGP